MSESRRPTIDTNNRDEGTPIIKDVALERASAVLRDRFKAAGDLALWRPCKL